MTFIFYVTFPYPILKGRGMLSSATSKPEGHNKDGGVNIMEKITISGLRNNVMENNIELMVLL